MILALALLAALAPVPDGVIEVACEASPRHRYALYAPPGYTPDQRWPILYVFDPRGRAHLALDRFRPGASARGFLIASSYDTRSDTDATPSLDAIAAMWDDTRKRLPIASRRSYAAGFSGGARLACQLGRAAKGELQGVIAAGGGFPDNPAAPPPDTPFGLYLTVGTTDFNWYEIRLLDDVLGRLGVPRHVETWDGPHAWPPVEAATRAIEWLDLLAMKRGHRVRDEALVRAWAAGPRARRLEQEGDPVGALAEWEALARDLQGLGDVQGLEAEAARLRGRTGVAAERARQEKIDAEDRRDLEAMNRTLRAVATAGQDPPLLGHLLRDLGVARLRARAAQEPGSYGALSAQRRLANLEVMAGFYLPAGLVGKGEYARAALCYEVAAEVRPDPDTLYTLACALARGGRRKEALHALRRAIDAGFADAGTMERDPDLESLRREPAFAALLERVARVPASPAPR